MATQKLTEGQRVQRWALMTWKLQLILDHFQRKKLLQEILGKATYLRVFQGLKGLEEARGAPSLIVTAVINGEIQGKQLSSSKSMKITPEQRDEQGLCRHPIEQMRTGGNKSAKWFTCLNCSTRWERLPLPDQSHPPRDQDLLLFGPHAHLTYVTVYNGMRNYVDWLLDSVSFVTPTEPQTRFIKYCMALREQSFEIPVPDEDNMDFEDVGFSSQSYPSQTWTRQMLENY